MHWKNRDLLAVCTVVASVWLAGCDGGKVTGEPGTRRAFAPEVNPKVTPNQDKILDRQGKAIPVASSRDEEGIVSDFVEGLIIVRPHGEHTLEDFLERYEGAVIADDALPEAPEGSGVELSEKEREPTAFVVRLNLSKVDAGALQKRGEEAGLEGKLQVSSEAALQTLLLAADAQLSGFFVSPDFVAYGAQSFPRALIATKEGKDGAGSAIDALQESRFGSTGSQSNVALAWQFVSAFGIERRVRVAIIDGGFLLDGAGNALGSETDFPSIRPLQYDFEQDDVQAGGPNSARCSGGSLCYWHGTASAGVATGLVDNEAGQAGTGGLVAEPLLLRTNLSRSQNHQAIRYAVALGADVVSMSYGGDCNQACRIYDREHHPFRDAVNAGKKTVFVAAAGNGRSGVGYEVGSPSYVHPCIESHVICVGALADEQTTAIGYSNFGAQVSIFAPTNIPVMPRPASGDPDPNGAKVSYAAGGTSASTPFVAGVAAMVKAIHPELNTDEVGELLRATAHPGAGRVTRYIDAYAAVRRAATGRKAKHDRYDAAKRNDVDPTSLSFSGTFKSEHLGLNIASSSDVDRFVFSGSSGAHSLQVLLTYPESQGAVSIHSFETLGGCSHPRKRPASPFGAQTYLHTFEVGGGPQLLTLRGTDTIAYDLVLRTAPPEEVSRDLYEPNNTPEQARWVQSYVAGKTPFEVFQIDPRVTLSANIAARDDVDYYRIRGAQASSSESAYFSASPVVKVYEFGSATELQVYSVDEAGNIGALLQSVSGEGCAKEPLMLGLVADEQYIVRVSGAQGNYKLQNGVNLKLRPIPVLVQHPAYTVLRPGDPVDQVLTRPEIFVLVKDPAFSAVVSKGTQVQLTLFDAAGAQIREGVVRNGSRRIDLSGLANGDMFVMQATPPANEEAPFELRWEERLAAFVSANLIQNPDAEITTGDDPIPHWMLRDGYETPRIFYYDNESETNPKFTDPGPTSRGMHLFSGGWNKTVSSVRQAIAIPANLTSAVDANNVRFLFSGYLGGFGTETDHAVARLTFLAAEQRELGTQGLMSITALEREGKTALQYQMAEDALPSGTRSILVDLEFYGGEGDDNDGYIDNLELVLSRYP